MFRLSILAAYFLCALSLSVTAVVAQDRLISPQEQATWNAVGRLIEGDIDTEFGCTATLIAPDLILTAAHCVPLGGDNLSAFIFVAGWNRGDYAAISTISEAHIHPEKTPGPLSYDSVYADIAILRLSEPLRVPPMPIGNLPDRDIPLAILGYRNTTNQAATLQMRCDHTRFRTSVVAVACPVHGGNSGSPLVDMTPLGPRIVSVISAKWGSGALAVRPQDWMADLIPNLPSSNSD